ncbi:MAG TPA: shikimate kinase [Acidimicrobiales bacterium]|nr:shikimate kinase [Acidimicrobiales bacterium]
MVARVVLVGLPGAGKSTLARALAQRLGCAALDTDEVLARRVATPTATYLRDAGEERFRAAELEALVEALGTDAVVATGAGVVTRADARDLLARERTLWLDAPDATLLARVSEGDRPLLGEHPAAALARLRAERRSHYDAVASAIVDTSGTLDEALERLCEAVS